MAEAVGSESCPARCKNLGTTGFTKTAMQAIQWHIFRNSLFFGRLRNIDLRTCANCKQLTVKYLQKHPVPRFLHRNYTVENRGLYIPEDLAIRQTWQYSSLPCGLVFRPHFRSLTSLPVSPHCRSHLIAGLTSLPVSPRCLVSIG